MDIQGNKVYPRDYLFDIAYIDSRSRTNLQRMQIDGIAPVGIDGNSVNIHHLTQNQDGALAEVLETFHRKNSSVIHINNPVTTPSGINRKEFDKWRKQYWMNRAKDFE